MLLLSHFSRVRLCDPIDGSPPGSPVPGILEARTLEWVAISFESLWCTPEANTTLLINYNIKIKKKKNCSTMNVLPLSKMVSQMIPTCSFSGSLIHPYSHLFHPLYPNCLPVSHLYWALRPRQVGLHGLCVPEAQTHPQWMKDHASGQRQPMDLRQDHSCLLSIWICTEYQRLVPCPRA